MKDTFRVLILFFAAAAVISICGVGHCDESEEEIGNFSGHVTEIDWVGSLVTCRGAGEVTFYIPPGMAIRQGTHTVAINDLHQGDSVEIKYVNDPSGIPRAVSVSLNKAYPEF